MSDRLQDPSRSRANRSRGDLPTGDPGSPLIASPMVGIHTYHPTQASRWHNTHIIRIKNTSVHSKANNIDIYEQNTHAKIDEDASSISCRRRRSRPTPKRPSDRSRQPVNTAVAPFELQASISQYSIQSQTMTTYITQSIHLGPCLDQHPACGLVAILGSVMERGGLGRGVGMLWKE